MTSEPIAQQPVQDVEIITARRSGVTMLRLHTFLAVIVGLALRLFFIFRFPSSAGDSGAYLQIAHNWADHHVYGLWVNGRLTPTDLRVPGYPAFLAGVGMLIGRSARAISLSQALVDMGTCVLTALLAAGLAPLQKRTLAWIVAFWLAATCPFLANYTAVTLTETAVTFFSTAALVCFISGFTRIENVGSSRRNRIGALGLAAAGSFLAGVATLVRPEMPLLLAVAAIVYVLRVLRTFNFRKAALFGAAMIGAFALPVLPWAARNFITLHEVQLLSPRFSTLPGEYAPAGYYEWTKTWLERYRDVYLSVWKIGEEPVDVNDLPPQAFDSPQERARIAALFDRYNKSEDLDITPEVDREFAKIAAERTRQNPLRTYIWAPFQRALSIWFTPRTELLPVDGKVWPLAEQWRDSHWNVLVTAGFAVLGYFYVALAAGGVWAVWRSGRKTSSGDPASDKANRWGAGLIIAYFFVRTLFLTTVEAPEPRYVVSCYPAVLALIALYFARDRDRASS